MTTILALHAPEAEKLEAVKAQMQELGAPTIRVVDCGNFYLALEGRRRIAAAHTLGLEPELKVFDQDEEISITCFDWYDSANWDSETPLAGEAVGQLQNMRNVDYSF